MEEGSVDGELLGIPEGMDDGSNDGIAEGLTEEESLGLRDGSRAHGQVEVMRNTTE